MLWHGIEGRFCHDDDTISITSNEHRGLFDALRNFSEPLPREV